MVKFLSRDLEVRFWKQKSMWSKSNFFFSLHLLKGKQNFTEDYVGIGYLFIYLFAFGAFILSFNIRVMLMLQ